MNAPSLQRNAPLVLLVSSLCLGLADFARGQTSGSVSSELQAAYDAIRQAQSTRAAPRATVPVTTTTRASDDIRPPHVIVTLVNESRDSQVGGIITLSLSLRMDGLPPGAFVNQINVIKAVDSLGNTLSLSAAGARPAVAMAALSTMRLRLGLASIGQNATGLPFKAEASFEAAVRKAGSLKFIEGTVEVFLPSESNGSIVRFPNVLNHAGRIEDPVLAKHGIEFHFLPDQASYDEVRNQIAGFHARATPPEFPKAVGFYLRDPLGRLAYHQLQDANGTLMRVGGSTNGGNDSRTGEIRLQAPLPADAQLVFFLLAPEAIKSVPFRVENVVLP